MYFLFFIFIFFVESKFEKTNINKQSSNCSFFSPKGFCQNYKEMKRTYHNDKKTLKRKISIFRENSKNGRIYLKSFFDSKKDSKIGPFHDFNHCKNELRVNYTNYDPIFCYLIVKYKRSYENLADLRIRYNIFLKSKNYYKGITDNYFDRNMKEIKRIPLSLDYKNCVKILSPIIARFFVDKKEQTTQIFCKLSKIFKRSYKTVGGAWSGIKYLTTKESPYIKRLFDKNPKNLFKIKSINQCIKDFYWEKNNQIKKSFCLNYKKKNLKIIIGNIPQKFNHFKGLFLKKYFKYAKSNRLINSKINKILNISYTNLLGCLREIKPVMLKYFKKQSYKYTKVKKFCINMILFKRIYIDVYTLRLKLNYFIKNMKRMKKLKNKDLKLTLHKNKFFDFTFDEIHNYIPDYIKADPKKIKMVKIKDQNIKGKKKHLCGNNDNFKKELKTYLKIYIEHIVFSSYNPVNYDRETPMPRFNKYYANSSRGFRRGYNKLRFLEIRKKRKERKLGFKQKRIRNIYIISLLKLIYNIRKKVKTNPSSILRKVSSCKKFKFLKSLNVKHNMFTRPINFIKAGVVNPKVYDQGKCGASWSFSVAGMIESRRSLIYSSIPKPLSRQYLLNCIPKGSCNSGNHIYGLQYLLKNPMYYEKDYTPYSAKKQVCKKPKDKSVKYNFFKKLIFYDKVSAAELKFILLKGPIAVNIDASPYEFIFYKKGILRYKCKKPNHSVLLVGWDRDRVTGKEYWIIRNSWGKDWGNKGNAYIEMDNKWDACGMYKQVVDLNSK